MTNGTAGRPVIPHISHAQRLTAAFRGIWLHTASARRNTRQRAELVHWLVAGVGFEPT
jgi:hypothetical protein